MTMYVSKRFPSLVEAVLEKRRLEQLEDARTSERYRRIPDPVTHDALPRKPAPIVTRGKEVYHPDPKVIEEIERDLYGPKVSKRKPLPKVVHIFKARCCPHCLKHFPYELHELTCKTITGK